jgi:hypothetical protein
MRRERPVRVTPFLVVPPIKALGPRITGLVNIRRFKGFVDALYNFFVEAFRKWQEAAFVFFGGRKLLN